MEHKSTSKFHLIVTLMPRRFQKVCHPSPSAKQNNDPLPFIPVLFNKGIIGAKVQKWMRVPSWVEEWRKRLAVFDLEEPNALNTSSLGGSQLFGCGGWDWWSIWLWYFLLFPISGIGWSLSKMWRSVGCTGPWLFCFLTGAISASSSLSSPSPLLLPTCLFGSRSRSPWQSCRHHDAAISSPYCLQKCVPIHLEGRQLCLDLHVRVMSSHGNLLQLTHLVFIRLPLQRPVASLHPVQEVTVPLPL